MSNPPYVPSSTQVSPEVNADPPEAVFSGEDGLDLMPHIIARAAELLKPGGVLAVEHDDTNADGVVSLLAEDGRWREVTAHRDLAARPRYVGSSMFGYLTRVKADADTDAWLRGAGWPREPRL